MTRAAVEAELLEWMGEPTPERDEERFDRIALALFRHQAAHCPAYGRYAESLGRGPDRVERADDVPAVPTGVFKELDLRGFPASATIRTFRTSGTSGDRPGRLHLDTLALYEASLLASLRRCLLVDLVGRRPPMLFLAPSADEAPESSLAHMFETLRRAEAGPGSGFHLREGRLDLSTLEAGLAAARRRGDPVVLAGTSFAFVHLLDALQRHTPAAADPPAPDGTPSDGAERGAHRRGGSGGAERWLLPHGSRVMETGGFKGRSREVAGDVLRASLADCFAIPETSVVNQYGMTELGSQFYDSTLVDPIGPRRKLAPPWTRVLLLDPEHGREVPPGEVGMVRIHDLANTGSVAAVQTADLGRAVLDDRGRAVGFEILGRAPGAEARGCSLATERMLGGADGVGP